MARTFKERLMGLAFKREAGVALLIPRCRAVHTFGMLFAVDLHWLDADGSVIRIDRSVEPRSMRACRSAAAVLEVPAALA